MQSHAAALEALDRQVRQLREWAGYRLGDGAQARHWDHGAAEWECDYPDWPALYTAVDAFVRVASLRRLKGAEVALLLYTLARDNEDECVLNILAQHPNLAVQLAKAAIAYPDADARWQAAVLLSNVHSPESAQLLRCFLQDEDEYVRRRTAEALRALQSKTG
jgi:HEAT repeat protein